MHWLFAIRSTFSTRTTTTTKKTTTKKKQIKTKAAIPPGSHRNPSWQCFAHLLDDLPQEDQVCLVVVDGVEIAPELWAWQGAVPEFIDESPHSLLLTLEPQVVAIPGLQDKRDNGVNIALILFHLFPNM